jgi:hypothetical protein
MKKYLLALELKLANFLPGFKTKILLLIGAVLQFLADTRPDLLSPLVPEKYQGVLPFLVYAAAYYTHGRLGSLHG